MYICALVFHAIAAFIVQPEFVPSDSMDVQQQQQQQQQRRHITTSAEHTIYQ